MYNLILPKDVWSSSMVQVIDTLNRFLRTYNSSLNFSITKSGIRELIHIPAFSFSATITQILSDLNISDNDISRYCPRFRQHKNKDNHYLLRCIVSIMMQRELQKDIKPKIVKPYKTVVEDNYVPRKIIHELVEYSPTEEEIKAFYKSSAWKRIRYDVIQEQGNFCSCCGEQAAPGKPINVDHILNLRQHWSKRLMKENLQVLCGSCNWGKGNRDSTNWRKGVVND